MADSNITRRALASALRELMQEMPFEKINIAHICERCNMNRKSFYYHFRDKYDLANWIFDTEFIGVARKNSADEGYDLLLELCRHMYSSKDFYRKAFRMRGQNSFSEHFREMLYPVLYDQMRKLFGGQELLEFHMNFFTDGFVLAVERWITEADCMPPEEFVELLRSCVYQTAERLHENRKKSK